MFRNLTNRVALSVLIVLATALALTVSLNYYKFDKTLSRLLQSRYEFVLSDMRNTVETLLTLGLPLAELDGINTLLTDQALRDSQITSIEIFDPSGLVLFSTDPSFVGDLAASSWMESWRGEAVLWNTVERDGNTVGLALSNSLGQVVGTLALRYDRRSYEQSLSAMGTRLSLAGLAILLVFSVIGGLVIYYLLKPTRDRLSEMEQRLSLLLVDTGDGDYPETDMAAEASAHDAFSELFKAEERIRELDRSG